MEKKFLSNLLLIVVLNLLVKPFYILGIDAEVQNRVGEVAYGNYFSLLNFSFLLNILLDFGITNFNARNIAQHPKLVSKHFGKILSVRFLLFFFYVIVTVLLGLIIGYDGYEFYLLSILMVNQFLVAILQFVRSNFAGLHLFKKDAFISILDRSLLILICSMLLWTNWFGGTMKIEWFIYAQTFAYGCSALIAIGLLWKEIGRLKIQLQWPFSKMVLKNSLPYAVLILLMMMYTRIDAVMLERLVPNGDHAAGVYAQGFRLLDAVNMFALLFAGMLLPIFARLIRNKEDIHPMTGLAFRLLFGISWIVGITCFVYQNELINLRYPGSDSSASVTFGWLILSFIPIATNFVFSTLLTANGSLKKLNILAFLGFILNVCLNFFFIKYNGAEGAALATLITQVVMALAQMLVAFKTLKIKFPGQFYLGLFGLVAGLIIAGVIVTNKVNLNTYQIIPFFMSGIALGFLLGVFKWNDFKAIIQR